MTVEKFKTEANTLCKFMQTYCDDKHKDCVKKHQNINLDYASYKDVTSLSWNLCEECDEMIRYALERLKECPHEIKPRCRRCPAPCYEKSMYKKMAAMMRHSGIKLGLTKIKKLFTFTDKS